jgi:hypothetical protein
MVIQFPVRVIERTVMRAARRQRIRIIVAELFERGDLSVDAGGMVRSKPTLAAAIAELCALL